MKDPNKTLQAARVGRRVVKYHAHGLTPFAILHLRWKLRFYFTEKNRTERGSVGQQSFGSKLSWMQSAFLMVGKRSFKSGGVPEALR
jgi:hypothetical protein